MEIRESRRVRTVASMLDMHESQIRRLIADGELEAHGVGRRGVRVYLDSVAAYQERRAKPTSQRRLRAVDPTPRRRAVTNAAHEADYEFLRKLNLVP